jgi:hypothetical protein
MLAEQFAGVPPYNPEQVQFQGPEPVTSEAVPIEQRSVIGAEVKVSPLGAPQAPSTGAGGAFHEVFTLNGTGPSELKVIHPIFSP